MLKRVRGIWIEGVLKHSLPHEAVIALGLLEQPNALVNPWHLEVQETNLPPHPLPDGTSITQIYDEANGKLLILGEPGAGKTTLLLELARSLLERAEQDEQFPIPVVFHLSSWARERQPLTQWLVAELTAKYRIPRGIGQVWIETDQLLVLLDGLDEVAETARPACIKAINAYQEEHGLVPIVVCCRRADYFAQPTRLVLERAVLVQPLTAQQIDAYLSDIGGQLGGVRQALFDDAELQEMVKTPLMLSIVTLAYQGETSASIARAGSPEVRRQQVFASYTQRMLARRRATTLYSQEQTTRWLAWLAEQLTRQSQTEFSIERMQPDWLVDGASRERYRRTMVRVIFGIEIAITAALFAWLRGGAVRDVVGVGAGLLGRLGSGPGNRILGWMAPGLGGGLEGGGSLGIIILLVAVLVKLLVSLSSLPAISLPAIRRGLSQGLRTGLSIGIIVGVFSSFVFGLHGLSNGVYRGAGMELFSGLLSGLMTGLIAGLRYEDNLRKQPVKSDHGQAEPVHLLNRLLDVLLFSLCALLGFSSIDALVIGEPAHDVIRYGSVVGLFYGIVFGVAGGTKLIPDLGTAIHPAEVVAWSWRTIGHHLTGTVRKGLLVGLAVTVSSSVALGCASGLFYGAGYGLRYGLVYGPILGVVGALASMLAGILNNGWSRSMLSTHQLFRPNEGIHRSLKNAAFAACIFGPLGGGLSGLVCGIAFGLVGGLPGWPILAGGFAIISGLLFVLQLVTTYGGIAAMGHYVLRWYLWRAGCLPWNYARFLDYAAERILLRKVGGGYIFVHRLLLDYFVTLAVTSPSQREQRERSEQ